MTGSGPLELRAQSSRFLDGARRPRRRAFLGQLDLLEDRLVPAGNITITNAFVVDSSGHPETTINVGEYVYIEANFTTQDLPGDASYVVGFTVNGLTQDTGPLTFGAGSSGTNSFEVSWGGFCATPGINLVAVTIDPAHTVSETTYADNTTSMTFSAALPAVGNVSYTVAQIRAAYGLNSVAGFGSGGGDGSGQTIALVEVGNAPTVLTDLDGFDQAMSLTLNSSQNMYQQYGPASSIVTVYNQAGTNITALVAQSGSNGVPAADLSGGWEAEETLDVEWAHAMAPGAKIDVIEVNDDASWATNLLAGDALAASLPGVSVVSNSWDLNEWPSETAYDSSTFITPSGHIGVTFLTSSYDNGASDYPSPPASPAPSVGNNGYFPATSPNVVAVGGTQLQLLNDAYSSETGWSFPAPTSTVNNGSSSYIQTGTWTSQTGGFSGTYSTAVGGTSGSAVWTVAVTPANTGKGTELSATWTASASNATNATYTIYDGTQESGTVLGMVVVDQTKSPTGNALGNSQFQELGVFSPALSSSGTGTLTVVLNASSANSRVVADAIGSAPAWASSGGPSPLETEPSYQLTYQNTRQRTTPDVSFDASEFTGVTSYQIGGLTYGNFGTSLASPCWAGLIAIANQGRVARGSNTLNSGSDPTQALRALYSLPAGDFHDITSGYNGFNAGAGYDEVTGRGSPIANLLIPGLIAYGATAQLERLVITMQPPASVSAGSGFGLTVAVEDSAGNVITSYNAIVAIALSANPGASTLSGRMTAPVTNGVAIFSGLMLNKPGTGYTLTVSGGSVAPATTAPFNVTQGGSGPPAATGTGSNNPGSSTSTSSPTNSLSPPPATAPTKGASLTRTVLTARPKVSAFGHLVTITAKVKLNGSARAIAAGSVTFTDGSVVLGTVSLHNGAASFTTSNLPIGRNAIRATYNGSLSTQRSRSAVVIETVRRAKSKAKLVLSGSKRLMHSAR